MKSFLTYLASSKVYVFVTSTASIFAAGYTDFIYTAYGFMIITTLDTITAIHASAYKKGLKFNPLKKYFWRQIKSEMLRVWISKVFKEYCVYLIIAFALEIFIIQEKVHLDIIQWKLDLPTAALWLFSAIELWSIGENVEKAGGTNWIKRIAKAIESIIPEKIKALFKKSPEN